MDKLFMAIEKHLAQTVAELRWIDWDFGQLEAEKPPVNWPCCLIDIPDISYSSEGNTAQLGQCTITLRLGFRVYHRSSAASDELYRKQGLAHLAVLQNIHKTLQGWESENFSALNRLSLKRISLIKHRQYLLTYQTVIYNREANAKRKLTTNFELQ